VTLGRSRSCAIDRCISRTPVDSLTPPNLAWKVLREAEAVSLGCRQPEVGLSKRDDPCACCSRRIPAGITCEAVLETTHPCRMCGRPRDPSERCPFCGSSPDVLAAELARVNQAIADMNAEDARLRDELKRLSTKMQLALHQRAMLDRTDAEHQMHRKPPRRMPWQVGATRLLEQHDDNAIQQQQPRRQRHGQPASDSTARQRWWSVFQMPRAKQSTKEDQIDRLSGLLDEIMTRMGPPPDWQPEADEARLPPRHAFKPGAPE